MAPASAPRRRPGRPPGGRLLAGRDQLLAAAERAVRSQGPEATMEDIAAEADVTKPILYRTIGRREALVEALAERLVDRISEAIGAAAASAGAGRAGLRSVIAAYVEVVAREQHLFLFVTTGGSGEDRLGGSLHLADRSAAPLATQLAAARSTAGLDPAVATTWAYGMVGMLQLATTWWLRDRSLTAEQVTDHLTDLLWSGLGEAG